MNGIQQFPGQGTPDSGTFGISIDPPIFMVAETCVINLRSGVCEIKHLAKTLRSRRLGGLKL